MGVRLVYFNKPLNHTDNNKKLLEDHNDLINRDIQDQHPIYAISGLNEVLSTVETLLTQQTAEHEYLTGKLHESENRIEVINILIGAIKEKTDELIQWKKDVYNPPDVEPVVLSVVDNDGIDLEYDHATKELEARLKLVANSTLYSVRNRSHTVNKLVLTKNGLYVPNDIFLDSKTISWETEQSTTTHAQLAEEGYYFSHKSTSAEDVFETTRLEYWNYNKTNNTFVYNNPNENSGDIWHGFVSRSLYTDCTVKLKFKYATPYSTNQYYGSSACNKNASTWIADGYGTYYVPLNNSNHYLANNGDTDSGGLYIGKRASVRASSNIGITLYTNSSNGNYNTYDFIITRYGTYVSNTYPTRWNNFAFFKNFKTSKYSYMPKPSYLNSLRFDGTVYSNNAWRGFNTEWYTCGYLPDAQYYANRGVNANDFEVEITLNISNNHVTFMRINYDNYYSDNPNNKLGDDGGSSYGNYYYGVNTDIPLDGPFHVGFGISGVVKATITKFEVTVPEGKTVDEEQNLITVDNFRPHLNISKKAGNSIQLENDGIYVHNDVSTQAENAIVRDASGNYFVQDTKISNKFGNDIIWDGTKTLYSRTKDFKAVTQENHGFVIGDFIYYSDEYSIYLKAIAEDSYRINVVGMVTRIVDTDNFEYMWSGYFATNIFNSEHGFIQGSPLYLSEEVEGGVTQIQPDISKSLGYPVENTGIIISLERGIQYNSEARLGEIKQSTNTYNVRTDGFIRITENVQYKMSLVGNVVNAVTQLFKENYMIINTTLQTLSFKNVNDLREIMMVPEGIELFIKAF